MKTRSTRDSRGFALIVTITLLVLLSAIALGFLSLSAVTLRSGAQEQAQAEARANARLALQIALGELQKQLGPDQRISAGGAITSSSSVAHPHWTGAWDSWIAGPKATASVKSDYPSAESHHSTIGSQADDSMRPEYGQKNRHFRAWLVSLAPQEAANIASASSLSVNGLRLPGPNDQAIRLVGKGSLGDAANPADFVAARLIDVASPSGGKGRYGWWVGDESQKARILHDPFVSRPPANDAEKIYRGQAPGSTGTRRVRDLEEITQIQEARLNGLASLNTLDLVVNRDGKQPAKTNFHSVTPHARAVLADVREGGLKRDLSVLLEQPIDRANSGPGYMLYAFDDSRFPGDRSHSRVPIQDLAAYYQLYDDEPAFANGRREGVRYTSPQRGNSLQTNVPDYDGGTRNRQRLLREYTAIYRQPVLTKFQFVLGVSSETITPQDRANIQAQVAGTISVGPSTENNAIMPVPPDDTHKLTMGIIPMVTLWNPTNLPMVMVGNQVLRIKNPPPLIVRWRKFDGGSSGTYETARSFGLTFFTSGEQTWQLDGRDGGYDFIRLRLQGNGGTPVVFAPGEVKVFTLAVSAGNRLTETGTASGINGQVTYQAINAPYDPYNCLKLWHSSTYSKNRPDNPHVFVFTDQTGRNKKSRLSFNSNDRFSLSVDTDKTFGSYDNPESVACDAVLTGAAFAMSLIDPGYQDAPWQDGLTFLDHFAMLSRHGGRKNSASPIHAPMAAFNKALLAPGFPGGQTPIEFQSFTNSIPGSQLIGAGSSGEIIGLFDFSLSLGCEAGALATGGYGGGRRIASRPFLHSGIGVPPFLDQANKEWLYTYGWDWQIGTINNLEDSIVTARPGTDNGYFGGGYTIEAGATHVVQREIPVLPLISIASLSHAQLGGFSLGYAVNYDGIDPVTGKVDAWTNNGQISMPTGVDFQKTSAVGQGGLAPQVSQALGNSYAHPNIAADKAFTTWTRRFDEDPGEGNKVVPAADHSYLSNKALWDEFFFSSISPQPSKVELFGGGSRTAKQVADGFFFGNGSHPLPNRRVTPYTNNLDQAKLDSLFTQSGVFSNGLGDKIGAHLMVDGAFNVNSTSVEAWKVFLSSLRGKPVAHCVSGKTPLESISDDRTVVNPGMLPNARPVTSAAISSPNQPAEQWRAGRELSDEEIQQLAEAMVRQVKLRGPFLSLSEFINRRLDASNAGGMALKGALQAALDDPACTINAQFRTTGRLLDGETGGIPFAFPDAAKGPIAYGSQPYVDQADVLRGLAEQLTARGDTFMIRTYGDSLDASGHVVARAWCEAVVQRVPDYVDARDENHLRTSDLQAPANRSFGRSFTVVSFRWLHADEV